MDSLKLPTPATVEAFMLGSNLVTIKAKEATVTVDPTRVHGIMPAGIGEAALLMENGSAIGVKGVTQQVLAKIVATARDIASKSTPNARYIRAMQGVLPAMLSRMGVPADDLAGADDSDAPLVILGQGPTETRIYPHDITDAKP